MIIPKQKFLIDGEEVDRHAYFKAKAQLTGKDMIYSSCIGSDFTYEITHAEATTTKHTEL